MARRVILASCLVSPVACTFDLPDSTAIDYRRTLAIQTRVVEPPEDPSVTQTRAEVRPMETLELTALVADPDGLVDVEAALDPIWIACERVSGQPSFACLDEALPLTLADLPGCDLAEFPCLAGRAPRLTFTVPTITAGASLDFTMIAATADGARDSDGCAGPLLAGDTDPPNDCMFAVHNVVIGPLPGVEANRNPDVDVEANLLDASGEVVESLGTVGGTAVAVPSNRRLELIGVARDPQAYEIPIIEDGELVGAERVEESFSGVWLRTGGEFEQGGLGGGGGPFAGDGLETVWSGDRDATLILVVRDGRGGVGWTVVDVSVD